jgi:hypothetical protein
LLAGDVGVVPAAATAELSADAAIEAAESLLKADSTDAAEIAEAAKAENTGALN